MEVVTMDKLKSFLKRSIPSLVFSAISLLVGILSALVTKGNMDIYESIETPPLSPPATVFPIVWSILFILMGVGAGMVYRRWEKEENNAREGLLFFAIQLAVNFIWSVLFFNAQKYLLCIFVLLLLLILVIRMAKGFGKVNKVAGLLQVPYILWLLFALYLNVGIVVLN